MEAGLGEAFFPHAGHGLGLGHPERPYLFSGCEYVLEPGQTPIPEKLPPLEPGFYLYQDVVLGVVDSALVLIAAGEAGETKPPGDSG